MRALRLVVLLAAAVVAGCGGSGAAQGVGAPAAGAGPPVGQAWFGAGFEPGTFNVQGQTTTIKAGSPVAVVGRILQPKAPEDMVVQIQRQGSEVARVPLPAGQPNTIFGVDLTGQNLGPGTYLVNFVDKNRRTLASGTLTVTQ